MDATMDAVAQTQAKGRSRTQEGDIADVMMQQEFLPLNKEGKTIFLPSKLFPNIDKNVTVNDTKNHFEILHHITGTVCDERSEQDQEKLRDIINGILDEVRKYTRSRICKEREIEACRHWEWRVEGNLVNSYEDIDEVLRSKWVTGRADMIEKCHTLMHGMYQGKKAITWFSEALQRYLDLKRIKLYTTEKDGTRKILPQQNLGRLLSFAKQARARTNRDRNKTLQKYQGIMIFSGKRSSAKKKHANTKPVNKFDVGCDGYYIDSTDNQDTLTDSLEMLLKEGNSKADVMSALNQIEDRRVARIPNSVSVSNSTRKRNPPSRIDRIIQEQLLSDEQYKQEEETFKAALMGDGEPKMDDSQDPFESLALDLHMVGTHVADQSPKKKRAEKTKKKENTVVKPWRSAKSPSRSVQPRTTTSPTSSVGNDSSGGSTVTEISLSSVSTANRGHKNLAQLKAALKPKQNKKKKQKPKQKKSLTPGSRQSKRLTPESKGDKVPNDNGKHNMKTQSTARRTLEVCNFLLTSMKHASHHHSHIATARKQKTETDMYTNQQQQQTRLSSQEKTCRYDSTDNGTS